MTKFIITSIIGCLVFLSCSKDENQTNDPQEEVFEIDDYNYKTDIPDMIDFYEQDPIQYYAEFGLPSITKSASILNEYGDNPIDAFDLLLAYFSDSMAQKAINDQLWSRAFIQKMQNASGNLAEKWTHTIIHFGNQVNQLYIQNPDDPQLDQLYKILGDGIQLVMPNEFFIDMMMIEDISLYEFPITNDWLALTCGCGMDDDDEIIECDEEEVDTFDQEPNEVRKWSEVDEPFIPPHRFDGKCATLAAGNCLVKLKQIEDKIDIDIWKDLSKKLGAKKRGGVDRRATNAYFKSLGFGVTVAADKKGETAVQQAAKAMAKGCDVKLSFANKAKKKYHVEYVTDIKVDKDDPSKAVITSISWGVKSTQDVKNGKFTNKEPNKTRNENSWLSQEGDAIIRIFCPVKK